jgi:hypothetical protein
MRKNQTALLSLRGMWKDTTLAVPLRLSFFLSEAGRAVQTVFFFFPRRALVREESAPHTSTAWYSSYAPLKSVIL